LEIEFYETASGNQPITEFIKSLKPAEQAKIARALDLLEEFGTTLGRPYVKLIPGSGGLWELRVPFGGQAFRLVFLKEGNTAVIVHAFQKKTLKTPKPKLDTAIARMKDHQTRKGDSK
jgi:phage-related protein